MYPDNAIAPTCKNRENTYNKHSQTSGYISKKICFHEWGMYLRPSPTYQMQVLSCIYHMITNYFIQLWWLLFGLDILDSRRKRQKMSPFDSSVIWKLVVWYEKSNPHGRHQVISHCWGLETCHMWNSSIRKNNFSKLCKMMPTNRINRPALQIL